MRGELGFDAIRIWFGDSLHLHIKRSDLLGFQSWKWNGNYKIEFIFRTNLMLVEYTDEARWRAVLAELAKLELTGE